MYVCLFDIDGTLLSSGGAGKAAMEAALVSEFGVTQMIGRVAFSGRTDRAIGRDLFAVHGIEHSVDNWQRFLTGYLRHLPTCLATHHGGVLPGILALLEQLQGHTKVTLGLLTGNIRHGARLKLGHYGLWDYFAFGGFGDDHLERCDVARETLVTLQRHLNDAVDPGNIWVIGDTPLDVSCARTIGARAAAVATGLHSREELAAEGPDLLLSDMSDPELFLRKLA